ncbi:MAG: bifunctional sugar-1-phosphate nucleotidylyltransferase/acetyltransferase [Candidatus Thorarchaeota archaeon]
MKAVILAAGKGERLVPITSSRPKPMIPLAGKPLLEHTILGLKNAGVDEILLVVGYKEEIIKNYFGNGEEKFKIKLTYVTQKEQLGTGDAVNYARNFVQNNPFFLLYGDLVVESSIFKEILKKFDEINVNGLMTLYEVQNPQDYGIISLNSEGFVEKITEKPNSKLNLGNLANAGIYIFDSLIFRAIENTEKSIRGEYEFTDSMQILINQLNGKIIGYNIKDSFWNDIGLPWQLFNANSFYLDRIEHKILGDIEQNVQISGTVHIGRNTVVKSGTYIQGPCYIGENSLIGPNAFLRPYSSIGDNCHVGMSEVKNSIIFSCASAPHFNYVGDSIICEGVNLGAGSKTSNLRFDNKSVWVNIKGTRIDSERRKLGSIIGPNVQTGINASIMCGKIIGENSVIGAHTLVNEDVPPNTLYYSDSIKGLTIEKNKFY